MNISVKKFSKKSLSLLIALIMVFSALPLTPPISAEAATTTSTINMTAMACFRSGNASRVGNDYISVCDDGENGNFVIALFNFDVTNIIATDLDDVSAIFNYYHQRTQDENKGISFYYPTQNLSEFNVSDRSATQPNTNIWSGNDSGHLTRAKNYYQLKELQININTTKTKTNAQLEIGPAIKYAKSVGNSVATVIAVIASPGRSGKTGGYTDTSVGYTNKSVSVTVKEKTMNSQEYKDYINSKISSWSLPSSENVAYFGTSMVNSNVLYSSNTFIDNTFSEFALSEKEEDTLMKAKVMAGVGRIVYMYTGDKSVAKIPLIAETDRQSSCLKRYRLNYISSATINWKFTDKWYATTSWNSWTASNSSGEDGAYTVYADSSHNTTDYTSDSGGITSESGWDFRNLAVYNGSVSFSNNYMKLTNPTIDMSFDGYCTWRGGGGAVNNISKSTSFVNYNVPVFSIPSSASYYMIDFSEMKDMYSRVKTNYNKIVAEESKYTDESLSNYYKAVAEIISYNAKGYGFSTDANVQKCALDLKNVIASYNSAYANLKPKKVTVTFYNFDDYVFMLTPTTTIEVQPGTSISQLPNNTATKSIGNNQHEEYVWINDSDRTEFTSSTVINSDMIVGEIKKTVNCSIVNKGIEGDTVNLECRVCKNRSTLNASAYKAAVSDAQNSIANSQAYTETSRDALSSVLSDQDTAINEAKTQKEVDNCTSAILSANQLKTENNSAGKLVYNQYSITVNYVNEKSEVFKTETITNVDYGTIKEVTAKTTFNEKDYVVYKWTRLEKDGDKLFGLNSTSVSVNVVGNLTYYVHLKSTQAEYPDNTAVVTLNNKAGKPVDVGYVTTNEPQNVVVNGNTIEIGETTTLTAPQYSFYSIKGFIVNGELITAKSGTKSITVTKDMTIIPLYDPESYVDITRGDGEIFTINGKEIKSYSARWDELITLEATSDVIWYTTTKNDKEVVLGQGKIFKFRANEKIEIYTKQEDASLTPNSRVGYFGYDADLKKVTIVNNFFVPDGANENVKAGVVVSTKAKTKEEMIKQYNAGSLKFEGGYDKFTADKNQIRITINRNGTGTRDFSMWALSYVIVDGKEYFADDVISYTYNSQSTTA